MTATASMTIGSAGWSPPRRAAATGSTRPERRAAERGSFCATGRIDPIIAVSARFENVPFRDEAAAMPTTVASAAPDRHKY